MIIMKIVMMLSMRIALAIRYRQAPIGPILHPFAVIATTAMQWWSLFAHLRGTRSWRGRTFTATVKSN